jgi:formamidopyrimidine-DNA glycosylase
MPELAEVETVRQQVQKRMVGHKIKSIDADVADRFLFAFAPIKDVRKALVGARVKGTGRKGKYFWLELDRKPWPIFHLGMSGNVALLDPKAKNAKGHEKVWGGAKMWSERDQDLRDRLWFCRLLLECDGGFEFAFIDPRRFGRMWLTDDPETHPRIKQLGYDPLLNFPTPKVLGEQLKRRKTAIKSVLLDQKIFAGVGNWLADEILFQAKLSPHHLAANLTAAQVKALHKQVLAVVKKAVAVQADYERFPKTWLFHARWDKGTKAGKTAKTSRGKIIYEDIGGRTTAWVPTWQK